MALLTEAADCISAGTEPHDSAEYLDTNEAVAESLAAAIEENGPAFLRFALGVVERARVSAQVADEAGMPPEHYGRGPPDKGNASFDLAKRLLDILKARSAETVASK
ncbi:putative addiction module antidote protein [Methylobacterium sp. WL9]|uniref:putative addiction module antidote protein n=1 Tax=Methylobacterium sp. WL9 TaxID=2603898 RepID=UPI0011C8CB19|nr:putative addiction module antidote protein [Methylobacterium sp. WL9]TXN22952.1 putative addiction module antidote protein [Methylobacterium sp. WL9]